MFYLAPKTKYISEYWSNNYYLGKDHNLSFMPWKGEFCWANKQMTLKAFLFDIFWVVNVLSDVGALKCRLHMKERLNEECFKAIDKSFSYKKTRHKKICKENLMFLKENFEIFLLSNPRLIQYSEGSRTVVSKLSQSADH